MNTLFIEFRDPLFGIIVFFVIIFIVTFFSYWWGKYKTKASYKHLDKFLKQFGSLPSQNELKVLIQKGGLSEKSWLLLAQSYSKNGDYEKSIEIYNEGRTYFKAGFLERAKQIFLEILKENPRTPQALHYLLLVYEHMREYKSALEVLEPLDELNENILKDTVYLKSLELLNDTTKSVDIKTHELLELYKDSHQMAYLVFEYLFRVNPKLAWENFDSSKSKLLVDILWHIDKKDLNLDIIANNGYLRELYTARGDINLVTSSSIFEFDILINLSANANVNATLNFEYTCDNCNQSFPFAFSRCSSCQSIDTLRVDFSLTKDYHIDFSQNNNSFQ